MFNDHCPTHKRHKSPVTHSKTIYVFTSGPVIVTLHIYSRKKHIEGVKMPSAKSLSIQERSRIYPIVLQDLMKRGVCRRAVEMLLVQWWKWNWPLFCGLWIVIERFSPVSGGFLLLWRNLQFQFQKQIRTGSIPVSVWYIGSESTPGSNHFFQRHVYISVPILRSTPK